MSLFAASALLSTATPVVAMGMSRFWFLLPLAVGVSLVYTASRYEIPAIILRRALGFFTKTMLAMGVIFLVLYLLAAPL